MQDPGTFTLVDRESYEPLSRYVLAPEYVELLRALLPDTWALVRDGVWVNAVPPDADVPPQGFKIHVSSIPDQAARVLERVVPALVEHAVQFKIAGDRTLLNLLNSKHYGRGGSGKFMTVYPRDTEVFRQLLQALHAATADEGLVGPYILSDRRYADSRILFYRYGGFRTIERLRPDGTRQACIRSPQGELVADERHPYFELPPWVEDPFGGSAAVQEPGATVLNGRYRVEGVLGFSNAGGVYTGTDEVTGEGVVIKEARPYTAHWAVGTLFLDAVALLEREYRSLRRLDGLPFVPRAVDLFVEWEHTFLVQTRIEGITFQSYCASEEHLMAPWVRRPERVESFVRRFRHVARSLIERVQRVHQAGLILGDVSPRNVLVQPGTEALYLIDFESAVVAGEDDAFMDFANQWMTPGFGNPERNARAALRFEDDFYGVAMLLYSMLVPVQGLFALKPSAREEFLCRFVELGVPRETREVIERLMAGDVPGACRVLARWEDGDAVAAPAALESPAGLLAFA